MVVLGWIIYVGGDWEQSLSVLLLCRRIALLLGCRSMLLLYRRWVLAGAGYGGGDICVGDSGGSDILVVILVLEVLDGGGGGGDGRLCMWVVIDCTGVEQNSVFYCAAGMCFCCGAGVYSLCIVGVW